MIRTFVIKPINFFNAFLKGDVHTKVSSEVQNFLPIEKMKSKLHSNCSHVKVYHYAEAKGISRSIPTSYMILFNRLRIFHKG